MTLLHPLWLLAVLPLVVHAAWRARQRGRRAAVLLRLAAGLSLAAAAASPACPGDGGGVLVVAVDASPSVPVAAREEAARRAAGWAEALPAGVTLQTVTFGGAVRAVAPERLAAAVAEDVPGGSDLALALRESGRLAGPGGAVVLLSDGRNRGGGDARDAAARLARSGLRVHAAPVWGGRRDCWVDTVTVPPGTRQGGAAPVTAVIRCVGGAGRGTAVFQLDGDEVARLAFQAPAGGAASLTAAIPFPESGRREVRVALVDLGGADLPGNDEGGVLVDVVGAARTLRVGAGPPDDPLGASLHRAGHAVEQVAPEALAVDAAGLSAYDLVVLEDVSHDRLAPGIARAVADYAIGGGGLLALGGPHSFGPGGYAGTPLDDVLPLQADPRRAGGRMAAVLLLDKSGSMGGGEGGWERLLLAKATVRSLLESFRHPEDRVGVLGYDTDAVVVLPMTAVKDFRPEMVDTGRLHPAGGTDPSPALDQAARWLGPAERVPTRHVLIVSDGRFPGTKAEVTIARLAAQGIRVSTVGIGRAADKERLRRLAEAGGSDFTAVAELTDLPAVVARQLLAAPRDPVFEGVVGVEAGPALAGLVPGAPDAIPPLGGIVRTALRRDAHLWLVSKEGDPVLAGLRQGAGRTAALATALGGPWASSWAAWEELPRLVDAVAAWTTRRSRGPWEAFLTPGSVADLTLTLDAVDGAGLPVSRLSPVASVQMPGGARVEVPMQAVAPGRYRCPVAVSGRGTVQAVVTVDGAAVARAGALLLSAPELTERGDDLPSLQALAQAGGGDLLGPGDAPPPPPGAGSAPEPRRAVPLLLAMLLFLAYVRVEGRAS